MADEKVTSIRNPFRLVINTFLFLFILLLVIYFGVKALQIYGPPEYKDKLSEFLIDFRNFTTTAWEFVKPLVQLVIILAIVDWLLKRLGISVFSDKTKFEWNVQTVIAIVIISAFALAALSGADIASLKDVALVVVGFYFGTQKKQNEMGG